MGKIVALINQKGGVGKTTTAVNLAAALHNLGKRILVCDFDPQGNATSGFGVSTDDVEQTIYDLIISENPSISEAIIHTDWSDLITADTNLSGAEIELIGLDQREYRLKRVLDQARDQYDYILIDCPPSLGILTLECLCAADSFLVPLQTEYYALEGLTQLMATVRSVQKGLNKKIRMEGILLTMYDGRTNLAVQVVEEVKKHFADKVYASVIPRNVRLSEAPSHGKPIMIYDPYCRGTEAYAAVAEEFLERNHDIRG